MDIETFNARVEKSRFQPVMNLQDAFFYASKIGRTKPIYVFHGTSKKNVNLIKKNGFRGYEELINDGIVGNHFTKAPWYSRQWGSVVLICQVNINNPMPEKMFSKLVNNPIALVTEAKKHDYDGCIGSDELTVWNKESIVIVGELKDIRPVKRRTKRTRQ